MKKKECRHFVIGKDFQKDGHTRITKGRDFYVEGGTHDSHEETVDVVRDFSDRVQKEGPVDGETAGEILKDVLSERRRRN